MHEDERKRVGGRAGAAPVCPVCGHPLGTTVRRYKTLGVFVPRWTPASCDNPDCGKQDAARGAEEPAGNTTSRRPDAL